MQGSKQTIVVVGSNSTIARAVVTELLERDQVKKVYAFSRDPGDNWSGGVEERRIDPTDEQSIQDAASSIPESIDGLFVATGVLHDDRIQPEKSMRAITKEGLLHSFTVNTIAPTLIAKYFLPKLTREHRTFAAFLSAKVGSISDNRLGGWYGYRSSKAALNMIIRNFAIEMHRTHPMSVVIGMHPGTVETPLSSPFHAGIDPNQVIDPAKSAQALLTVLNKRTPQDTGLFWGWNDEVIAP